MSDDVRPAVLVTRPPPGGQELAAQLEAAGLQALLFPVLELVPPEDASPLRQAAERAAAGAYDWIALTSANGVRAFSRALAEARGSGPSEPPPVCFAVVGAATAAAAAREGWSVDLVPERYTAEGLVEAFAPLPLQGRRVLLPVAEAARSTLPEGLRARGAEVDVVVAYRTVVPRSDEVERLRALVRGGALGLTTLASPSAAEGLLDVVGPDALAVPVVAIGPVTAEAAEVLGYRVVAVAAPHTAEGLVGAAVRWLRVDGSSRRPPDE